MDETLGRGRCGARIAHAKVTLPTIISIVLRCTPHPVMDVFIMIVHSHWRVVNKCACPPGIILPERIYILVRTIQVVFRTVHT